MKRTNGNGASQLPNEIESTRLQVIDLEMKARYWKAQYEIRKYTLDSEALEMAYGEWLDGQAKKQEKALEQLREQAARMDVLAQEGQLQVGDESALMEDVKE